MCDYSLQSVPNRLAVEGERLMVHRFRTGSIGLAPAPMAVQEQPPAKLGLWGWLSKLKFSFVTDTCAVCIPPGAMLVLHGVTEDLRCDPHYSGSATVKFTQLSAQVNRYRDAIQFPNGTTRLLQHLQPGQLVDVVSLDSTEAEPRVLTAEECVLSD